MASAALLGGVALTTVASAHEGGDDLHYLAKATSFEHTELGDDGHQIVVNFDLFEDDHGEEGTQQQQYTPQDHGDGDEAVGHGVATCVTANADEGVLCSGNIMVDDGQISSQGIVHVPSHHAADAGEGEGEGESDSVLLPITGGSGSFVGAAGEVEISHEGHEESADSEASAPSSMSAFRILGMIPADHGDGGGKHGGWHHALHLIFHLQ
ncbi:MAG: hypothetical protein ACRD0S_10295 [Acidimicrobiales bacterium]